MSAPRRFFTAIFNPSPDGLCIVEDCSETVADTLRGMCSPHAAMDQAMLSPGPRKAAVTTGDEPPWRFALVAAVIEISAVIALLPVALGPPLLTAPPPLGWLLDIEAAIARIAGW